MGAHRYSGGQAQEGRAYVYHGASSGLPAAPSWTAESDQADARFGHAVGTAGDVNGDSYADVVVGAYQQAAGQAEEGRAYVYYGSASGLAAAPDWTAEGGQASAWFGYAVGTAGDVNGDGYAEVIVGASGYTNAQQGEDGRTCTTARPPACGRRRAGRRKPTRRSPPSATPRARRGT